MNRPLLWILGILIAIIAITSTIQNTKEDNPLYPAVGEEQVVTGVITGDTIQEEDRTRFTLKVKTINGKDFSPYKLQVTLSHSGRDCPLLLQTDDLIRLKGELSLPDNSRNPGGFNYAAYLKSQGIYALLYTKETNDIEILDHAFTLNGWISKIRNALCQACDRAFSPEQSDVIKGIFLGEKQIDPDIQNAFSDAGIAHVMAVSGLHVGYLYALVLFIAGMLHFKPKQRLWLLIPLLGFYSLLTGAAPSVIRASLMILAAALGEIAHQKYDALSGLCLAACIILLMNPAQLFSAGFQLSFCAVLSIILFYRPLCFQHQRLTGFTPGKIIEALILTFSATIGTLAPMLYHFHTLNLISLFSNILMVPLAGILLIFAFITVPLITLFPGLTGFLSLIPSALAQVILDLSNLFARLPGLQFHGAVPNIISLVLIMTIVLALGGYFNLRHRKHRFILGACMALLMVLLCIFRLIPKPLTITFLDVGQGDSALIETPSGGAYLIDGGGYEDTWKSTAKNRTPISEKVLLPALYSKGITELDGVFITHNHADHAQGIEELLSAFPIKQIFVSTKYNGNALLEQTTVPITVLSCGMTLSSGDGVKLEILWPDEKNEALPDDEQNEASLVIKLTYGQRSFLFTGDAGLSTENQLQNVDSDVLKIGHHGSNSATNSDFIDKVSPAVAIISVGAYNTYGHPTEQVLQSIQNSGALCYRTDQNGAIMITTDGESIKIKTYL